LFANYNRVQKMFENIMQQRYNALYRDRHRTTKS